VGIAATLVHFVTLGSLVEICGFQWPTFASAVGCVFGIVTSYFGNYTWTFGRTEPHRNFLGRFILVYVCTLFANTLLLYLLIRFFDMHYGAAFLLGTAASAAMNFLLSKHAVFQRSGIAKVIGRHTVVHKSVSQ